MDKLKTAFDTSAIIIPSEYVPMHSDMVTNFNEQSTHIEYPVGTDKTVWHFDNMLVAMQAVVLLQELNATLDDSDEIPYCWAKTDNGKPTASLIIYGMEI